MEDRLTSALRHELLSRQLRCVKVISEKGGSAYIFSRSTKPNDYVDIYTIKAVEVPPNRFLNTRCEFIAVIFDDNNYSNSIVDMVAFVFHPRYTQIRGKQFKIGGGITRSLIESIDAELV
jgi:hypothetical protein